MRHLVSRSQRLWDTHPSRVPTQSSEETTDTLFTVPWRHWRLLRTRRRTAPKFVQSRFHRDSGNGRSGDGYGVNLSYSKLWPRATNKYRPFHANICDENATKNVTCRFEFIRVSDRNIRMTNLRCPSWNQNKKGISVYSIRALPMLICWRIILRAKIEYQTLSLPNTFSLYSMRLGCMKIGSHFSLFCLGLLLFPTTSASRGDISTDSVLEVSPRVNDICESSTKFAEVAIHISKDISRSGKDCASSLIWYCGCSIDSG